MATSPSSLSSSLFCPLPNVASCFSGTILVCSACGWCFISLARVFRAATLNFGVNVNVVARFSARRRYRSWKQSRGHRTMSLPICLRCLLQQWGAATQQRADPRPPPSRPPLPQSSFPPRSSPLPPSSPPAAHSPSREGLALASSLAGARAQPYVSVQPRPPQTPRYVSEF